MPLAPRTNRHARVPLVRTTFMLFVAAGILATACKFSFAESKHPSRGSVEFGAQAKGAPRVDASAPLGSFKTIFADVAQKVVPTVVSVIPTKIDTVVFYNNPFYRFFDDGNGGDGSSPFDFFFGQPGQQPQQSRRGHQAEPPMRKQERRQQGMGSGVIVSKDGYILTNNHVVMGADEIEVKLSDGRSFEAEIVGTDTLTDVAVIKMKEKVDNLPVVALGNSDNLRTGDWAIAVGNPFALTSTVTVGIVSALGRSMPDREGGGMYQNFIQTDAAINPGNSGGALVNIDGELIGINTMIITPSGGFAGIGMAIPVNMAKWVMESLIYDGKVIRGWLGVNIQDVDAATRDVMGLDDQAGGVLIGNVIKGQPAEKAGIKRGDVVLSIDGKVVKSPNELRNIVASIDPGKKIDIVLMRNSKRVTVQATLATRDEDRIAKTEKGTPDQPEEKTESADAKKLGITVANLTQETRDKYNLPKSSTGAVITAIDQGSQLATEGLREGDVVREVRVKGQDTRAIAAAKDFSAAVSRLKDGDAVMLLVERGENTFFVAFRYRAGK